MKFRLMAIWKFSTVTIFRFPFVGNPKQDYITI